jgi:hypothetical protein
VSSRLPIAARFWIVLAVLVAAMAAMAIVAVQGLGTLHDGTESLHERLQATSEQAIPPR